MTTFAKGHGTENDFVVLPDPHGRLHLTPEGIRALTDRRAGIGGDGVIRVVPARDADEPEVRDQATEAEWFMDYRNADGSVAQMCGNGVRVFAAYLRREGLDISDTLSIATRAGVKRVKVVAVPGAGAEEYAVHLGQWRLIDSAAATANGYDCMVLPRGGREIPGLSIDVGSKHTVVMLPEEIALEHLDLTEAPTVTPAPPDGSNVEFVRVIGPGHIAMRVHERGVGETRSCGTGAAAAVAATHWWAGSDDHATSWLVDVPGGRLTIRLALDGIELQGPAVFVADGQTALV